MTKDEAMKLAQDACPYKSEELRGAFYEGFIKALDHFRGATKMIEPSIGLISSEWACVGNEGMRFPERSDLIGGETDCIEEPPTDSQIIAGAIYDFAGFLTTRDRVIKVGATADAAPVADLIKEWANRRSLSLENAAVGSWEKALAEPDMGIDRGAWDDVPDATKWVDELRGGDETEQETVALESVYEIIIHWDEGGGKRSRRELARRIMELYTAPPEVRQDKA